MGIKTLNLKITNIEKDTHDTAVITFGLSEPVDFIPGQFMMIAGEVNGPEGKKKIKRAYSIASSPKDKDKLEFIIKDVGEGGLSHKLVRAKPGDEFELTGPFGKFVFEEFSVKNVVLLSAGCGLSPLRAIARHIAENNLPIEVQFIYSVRTPKDIIRRKEFEEMASKYPNFEIIITVTRPEEGMHWDGEVGRINADLIRKYAKSVEDSIYYICGPKEMVKSMISILKDELGVAENNIKAELW